MYSNGAKMVGMFPVSLPLQGVGAIVTVMGYLDYLDFSITAATVAMPEPQELRDDMLAAFVELSEQVLDRRRPAIAQVIRALGRARRPVPVGGAEVGRLVRGPRLVARPDQAQARRHHHDGSHR